MPLQPPFEIPHSRPWLPGGEIEAIRRVLESGYLGPGSEAAAFESELGRLLGGLGVVALQSGTSALHLALLALGVGYGREVVLPSWSCAALLNAVYYVGAYPRLADVDPATGALTPETVRAVLTPAVRAIVSVHPFGHPAPIADLAALGIPLVEDCAMACGADYDGHPAGSRGDVAVFSFYATKVLATGQGGAFASRDPARVERVRDLIRHDERESYAVRFNYALSDLPAALGRVQLSRLPEALRRRRALAARYARALEGIPGLRLPDDPKGCHLFYRYVIRTDGESSGLAGIMAESGVEAKRPVFRPLHRYLGQDPAKFPGTESLNRTALSIPLYPALSDDQADRVAAAVRDGVRRPR